MTIAPLLFFVSKHITSVLLFFLDISTDIVLFYGHPRRTLYEMHLITMMCRTVIMQPGTASTFKDLLKNSVVLTR